MKRSVLLLVATCLLVACGPPAQQAPARRPDLSTPPEHKPHTLFGKEIETKPVTYAKGFLLFMRLVIREPVLEGYDRNEWKHWTDEDDDCQDTRQEVLIAESEIPVTFKTERECEVLTGRWTCAYTGEVVTDPSKLDVAHMVPLAAAHAAGAFAWDADRKRSFANDLAVAHHLIAVKASANRSKGKRGPDGWLPDNEKHVCKYVTHWMAIKDRWKLTVSKGEHVTLNESLKRFCSEDGMKAMTATTPSALFQQGKYQWSKMNVGAAFEKYAEACHGDYAKGCRYAAQTLVDSEMPSERIETFFRKACDLGDSGACSFLAKCYEDNCFENEDEDELFELKEHYKARAIEEQEIDSTNCLDSDDPLCGL